MVYLTSSSSASSAAFHDSSEDFCSICLEPFSNDNPATITSCKHEYHMHCILNWSQRSKECPICWQLLVLKDPDSQELLAAVEAEKNFQSRNIHSSPFTNSHSPLEQLNSDHGSSCSDDIEFDEQVMQCLVETARTVGYVCRRTRRGSSEYLVFDSLHVFGDSSPTSGISSASDIQSPPSALSPVDVVGRNTTSESDDLFKPRVLHSQPPSKSVKKPNTSEMFAFSESIRSKFSAASARYRESISKSTRGLKEKLVAHNTSVKELISKGFQREMNAGIAGVARMMECLDLTLKRASSTVGTSGSSLEKDS